MHFDWDINKNKLNIIKHSADFNDAIELFQRELVVIPDRRLDYQESRFIGYGYIKNRLMNVVYTERSPNIIRIISFRKANNREKKLYEQIITNQLG